MAVFPNGIAKVVTFFESARNFLIFLRILSFADFVCVAPVGIDDGFETVKRFAVDKDFVGLRYVFTIILTLFVNVAVF